MLRRLWARRWVRWLLIGGGAVALLWVATAGGTTIARYYGWTVERLEPGALSALLRPGYRIAKPTGAGPFPTALLYSGCDGPKDNLERWSGMLVARGWATIIVDSHGPRDLGDYERWRLVCSGQLLMGSERAGDVLVSIGHARRMPFVDPDRLALVGSSHGGWAIMDLFALAARDRLPFNLAGRPAGLGDDPLDGVAAALLLYPYCGIASRARGGWDAKVPVLFVLSADDRITPSAECLAIAALLEEEGKAVDTLVFSGVTHGFDQKTREPFSILEFDEEATRAALDAGAAFLDRAVEP